MDVARRDVASWTTDAQAHGVIMEDIEIALDSAEGLLGETPTDGHFERVEPLVDYQHDRFEITAEVVVSEDVAQTDDLPPRYLWCAFAKVGTQMPGRFPDDDEVEVDRVPV